MVKLNEKEEVIMQELLDKMETILNSSELMRNVDIVGELLRIVEKEYDI